MFFHVSTHRLCYPGAPGRQLVHPLDAINQSPTELRDLYRVGPYR